MKKGKGISFLLLGLLIVIMILATVLEKFKGTGFVIKNIYASPIFVLLWLLVVFFMMSVFVGKRLFFNKVLFAVHFSFVLILLGALLSWCLGQQGMLHLRKGKELSCFYSKAGIEYPLPFDVELGDFGVIYYPGTPTAQDYISQIQVKDLTRNVTKDLIVSMNKIGKYRGYRFYQSGYDQDGQGTRISVAHNPIGITMTYSGYFLLIISILVLCFKKESDFRRLLKKLFSNRILIIILFVIIGTGSMFAETGPKVLPKNVANDFCKMNVLYNGRICPLQTVAYDFTSKLYGNSSYKDYTAEQVFTGWIFYFTSWRNQPMLKIKGSRVRETLGINTEYACFNDFFSKEREYKIAKNINRIIAGEHCLEEKYFKQADEKYNIIGMLYSGDLMKIFPVLDTVSIINWYAPGDYLPDNMSKEKWVFIRKSLDYARESVVKKDWKELSFILEKIMLYQQKEASIILPSNFKINSERVYNKLIYGKFLAMLLLCAGIFRFGFSLQNLISESKMNKYFHFIFYSILVLSYLYISISLILRGIISSHIPLSNGFETMFFMAWCCLTLTWIFIKRFPFFVSFGFLSAGLSLMVAMFSKSDPSITHLVPVLSSPLLSIHVVTIMLGYSFLMYVMFNGITALILYKSCKNAIKYIVNLQLFSQVILYPAIICLTIGIIFGSIWANVSWGRYWGWDPKEVWALITLLIYTLLLHSKSIKWLSKPMNFHLFTVIAFFSVIFTYFGVRFLLGGIHSYGN